MEIIIVIIILNFFLCQKIDVISKSVNIFDIPNNKLKIHKTKVALLGGLIGFVNLLISVFFFQEKIFFDTNHYLYFFFISILTIFGFFDDKYILSGLFKMIFLISFLLIFLIFLSEFQLEYLEINSLKIKIKLITQYSIFFSLLCFFVLINAINFFDGVDLQSTSYFIFCYIYIYIYTREFLIIILIISLFAILFLNYTKKIFQGDSGIFFYTFILGCYFIKSNNLELLDTENIILICMLPIIDMLRVFILRIINKKHLMVGDLEHMHHLLKKKFSSLTGVLISLGLAFIPLIIYEILDLFLISLFLGIVFYFIIIFYCYYKFREKN